jgi:hypothetical protein
MTERGQCVSCTRYVDVVLFEVARAKHAWSFTKLVHKRAAPPGVEGFLGGARGIAQDEEDVAALRLEQFKRRTRHGLDSVGVGR